MKRIYSLKILFWPSYILPLIEFVDDSGKKAIKTMGYCRDLVIEIINANTYRVVHSDRSCVEYASYILGRWVDFDQVKNVLEKNASRYTIIRSLVNMFYDYGIAVSPRDDIEVFVSIFLSQNTDYHKNTVKWVKKLLRDFALEEIIDPRNRKILEEIGGSYQLRRLPEALKCYLRSRERILAGEHKLLLECPYVGPKIYYAYRLHVLLDLEVAPIDTNFFNFVERNLFHIVYSKPNKNLCRVYECGECPNRDKCIESILRSIFGISLGWLQTIVFLYTDIEKGILRINNYMQN